MRISPPSRQQHHLHFHFFMSFIIFTYVSLFVSCLLTTAARRGIGESVYSLFFSQQRVSQLIFLPLADEREVGGSGRSGAAAAARPGQRYVRVIANCLFIFDIVSHIIICLSPHPQADGNENGKQEVGGGSRVVGGMKMNSFSFFHSSMSSFMFRFSLSMFGDDGGAATD